MKYAKKPAKRAKIVDNTYRPVSTSGARLEVKVSSNPFEVVRMFEEAVADYCGSPYCVAVNSCTNALFLALRYSYFYRPHFTDTIEIPKHTYISVPMQIYHAGYEHIKFRDEKWSGVYQLKPLSIWDAARRFHHNMYWSNHISEPNNQNYVCVSFHWSKILGIQQGGAILHNDIEFDHLARRARFD